MKLSKRAAWSGLRYEREIEGLRAELKGAVDAISAAERKLVAHRGHVSQFLIELAEIMTVDIGAPDEKVPVERVCEVLLIAARNGREWAGQAQERLAQLSAPVPLILRCPSCGKRHVDEGEFATKIHHTHACQECGEVWRPAVVPTVGVRFLPGFGPPSITIGAKG